MKKQGLMLFLLLPVLCLTGCSCKHKEWNDADCEHPKTCVECGATDGEPLSHQWLDANCLAAKTCELCGLSEGEKGDHSTHSGKCENCGEFILDEAFIPGKEDFVDVMMYNYLSNDFSHTILNTEIRGTRGFSAYVEIPASERIEGLNEEEFDYVLHYYGTTTSNCLEQFYMYLNPQNSEDTEGLYNAIKSVMNERYGNPVETHKVDGEEFGCTWHDDTETIRISVIIDAAIAISMEIIDFPY